MGKILLICFSCFVCLGIVLESYTFDCGGGFQSDGSHRLTLSIGGVAGNSSDGEEGGIATGWIEYSEADENVQEHYPLSKPKALKIISISPTPFNSVCKIEFESPQSCLATMSIYSFDGREICSFSHQVGAGMNSFIWYADEAGSGVYFVNISAGDISTTQKTVLIR